MIDFCIHNIASLYTMDPSLSNVDNPLGCISNAAIGLHRKVVFIGSTDDAPSAKTTLDAKGCILMPGLVDCHTHALYGGSRSTEFAARLAGASYADILEGGGGIHSTVRATVQRRRNRLSTAFKARLTQMIHKGITTVEVKGGYGLSTESERRVHRLIKTHGLPISTVGTFLLLHHSDGMAKPSFCVHRQHHLRTYYPSAENGWSLQMYTVTEEHLHSMNLSPFYPLQKRWG